jgi:hypothetical protein
MTTFSPSYLNIDFQTLVNKFKNDLSNNAIFKDTNFEGSNINILLELNSYISELNTFYVNKIAKNVFIETSDVFESTVRLARQVGYNSKGIRSARATVSMEVSGTSSGDIIRVLPWKQINSGRTSSAGDQILFATTESLEVTASGDPTTLNVPLRQGTITELTGYTGDDIIDNELILPKAYAYDDDLTDNLPSIKLVVNDEEWTRVEDFYDDLIPNESDNVYQLLYDRYKRSKILFSSARNVPTSDDDITITVLDSLGTDGSINADSNETWNIESDQLIEKTTGITTTYVDNSLISISLSAASIGASAPETIDEIKFNAQSALRSQFRDINSTAYNSYLSARSDVIKAIAYGEQDLVPSGGDPQLYNIVHISTIPDIYGTNTINTSASTFVTDWGSSGSIYIPTQYSTSWKTELLDYLKPRKMIGVYETFEVPDLVYFSFEIGVKKKRIYDFIDIKEDVLNKLIYYFRNSNQLFNDEVDFNEIEEYLIDISNVSPTDNFDNIKGIRNLNIRDINCSKTIYEYNANENDPDLYPRYIESPYTNRDNMLRKIKLGLKQFPVLSSDTVRIFEET